MPFSGNLILNLWCFTRKIAHLCYWGWMSVLKDPSTEVVPMLTPSHVAGAPLGAPVPPSRAPWAGCPAPWPGSYWRSPRRGPKPAAIKAVDWCLCGMPPTNKTLGFGRETAQWIIWYDIHWAWSTAHVLSTLKQFCQIAGNPLEKNKTKKTACVSWGMTKRTDEL